MQMQVQQAKDMKKTFFGYAVPSIIAMWVFSFYTMVDGFFVSRGVGPLALAAVNVAMPFVNLLFGLSILFSAGASTVISIYLGRGDKLRAREAFMVNLATLGVLSAAITAAGLYFADEISLFLGATPLLFADVKSYLQITAGFVLFFIVTYYFEVTVRADGFPKMATAAVIVAALSNIILDYIFVMRFGWGVAGAAWATGIAQVLSALSLLAHFLSKRTQLGFSKFRYRFTHVARSVRLGIGDSVTEFSVGAVIFLFNNRILHVIGEEGVVSYTVMAYVTTLVVMTMSGISQGMQPLVGYSYGKGDEAGCACLLKLALKTAVACSIGWFAVMEIFGGAFVSLFIDKTKEAALFAHTISAFRVYAVSYLFIGVNVVLSTFFSSIERPLYGITLSTSRGLVVIATTLFAMAAAFGAAGIWLSPTVSEIVCLGIAAVSFYMLRSKKEQEATNVA